MYQVIKRDGRKVDFDLSRIAKAITKQVERHNRNDDDNTWGNTVERLR